MVFAMANFGGSMVAIVTPMEKGVSADRAIDWPALDRFMEFHIASGTVGIVAVGTTGESATLSEEEHCQAIKCVVDKVAWSYTGDRRYRGKFYK